MNPLRDDKAPYILGLLATLLGWQVNRVAEDVRATLSVAYWLEETDGANRTLVVENVSRQKSVTGMTFALVCQQPHCIVRDSSRLEGSPPTWTQGDMPEELPEIQPDEQSTDVSQVKVTTTIAAGGKVLLIYRAVKGQSDPTFYFIPDKNKALDIYVLKGDNLKGWAIRNYFNIVVGFLALTLSALAIALIEAIKAGSSVDSKSVRKKRT